MQVSSTNLNPREIGHETVCLEEPGKCRQLEKPRKNTRNCLKIATNGSKWKKHHTGEELRGQLPLLCSCSGLFSKYEPRK